MKIIRDVGLIAALTVALLLPWIFFDVDLGDQAFYSLNSWLMAFRPDPAPGTLPVWFEGPPVWFSVYVGSLWWKIIGSSATILASRVGWVIWNALAACLLGAIFGRVYGRSVVWPVLLGVLAVNCAAEHFVFTYTNVPPVLGALAIGCFALAADEQRKRFAVLAGFFAVLASQARLPSAPFLGVFFLASLTYLHFRGRRALTLLKGLSIGAAAGLVFCVLILEKMDQWQYFLPGLQSFLSGAGDGSNARYSRAVVFERALGHGVRIFGGFLLFGAGAWLVGRWPKLIGPLAAIFALVAVAKYGPLLAIVLGGAIFMLAVAAFRERKAVSAARAVLLFGAISLPIAFTFGTNLEGMQNFKYGLWILVPVAWLESARFSSHFDVATRRLLVSSVLLLFAVTRVLWPTFPFLERTIFSMREPFSLPAAAGILTYPEKKEILEGLVNELGKQGLAENGQLFCYSGEPPLYPIATVHQLTRTAPYLSDPALVEYPVSRWNKSKRLIEAAVQERTFPRLVVRGKQLLPRYLPEPRTFITGFQQPPPSNAEPFRWGDTANGHRGGEVDEILRRGGYQPVWENGHFVILRRN